MYKTAKFLTTNTVGLIVLQLGLNVTFYNALRRKGRRSRQIYDYDAHDYYGMSICELHLTYFVILLYILIFSLV